MDRAWRQAGSAAARRIPGPFATVGFSKNIRLKLRFYLAPIKRGNLLITFAEKGRGVGPQNGIIRELNKGRCMNLQKRAKEGVINPKNLDAPIPGL